MDPLVQKKKKAILCLGVLLYFLTTMSKVLVPATILDELLGLGTLSMVQISLLGGCFWYAYAISQLLAGIFSDRYGGVRILLLGGSFFSIGALGFPLSTSFSQMLCFRILAGLGAGTAFLGIAKLLADLYSRNYSIAMGTVLFIAFLGTPCGTSPMTALVKASGWRVAMLLPGAVALVAQIAILSLSKGTIQPARRGNALLPLWEMIHNGKMWMICIPSSIMYGAYYMIITLIGQKSLTDIFEMNCITAARIMLILTFFVAGMTMGVNALLRLFGNRRKATALLGGGCTVAGVIAGYLSFSGTGALPLLIIAYFLLAIPGGFFALFCTIGKELNPPEDTGLAVAAINFMASSAVATFQYFGGMILGQFPLVEQHVPMEAYQTLFKVLAGIACCGIIPLLCLPETNIDSSHAH